MFMSTRLSVAKVTVAAVIGIAFLFVVVSNRDPDLPWRLTVGAWINDHGAVPRTDIYSHTMPGHPWVDHEWLQHALLAQLNAAGGVFWWMAIAVFTLLAAMPFVFWIW